ncbi:hypothetical protein B0H14DRAFT_2656975 [Mycena olivaceomarginata]|nr:hypothetical protein B0H14DRAFT_2656975 [Mycena olivaceomarginata]
MTVFDSRLLPDTTKAHIQELSRTYGAPPDHLLSTISALSDELDRCNAEIAPLKTQLTEIETNHTVIHELRLECCGLLSPLRRLPSEILVKIFELRWHTVVMGTVSLWTVLELDPILWESRSDVDRIMQLLRLSLGRGLLATHSAGWNKMEIWGPRDQIPAMISAIKGVSFPGITLGLYLGCPSHRSSDDRPFYHRPPFEEFRDSREPNQRNISPATRSTTRLQMPGFHADGLHQLFVPHISLPRTTAFCLRINFDNWPEVHSGVLNLLQNAPLRASGKWD